jgi:hypothetical protein
MVRNLIFIQRAGATAPGGARYQGAGRDREEFMEHPIVVVFILLVMTIIAWQVIRPQPAE